jgi:tetratricopeptide (TPR) repeat protein
LKKGDINTYVKSTNAILHRLDDDGIAESLRILRKLNQHTSVTTLIKAADKLEKTGDALDAERMLAYAGHESESARAGVYYKKLCGVMNPSDHILQCLAEFSYRLKRYDRVIKHIQAMKEPDSGDRSIQWQALIASGAADVAEQLIVTYLKEHEDCFEGWYQLARIKVKTGETDSARKYLLRAFDTGFYDLDRIGQDPSLQKIYDSFSNQ